VATGQGKLVHRQRGVLFLQKFKKNYEINQLKSYDDIFSPFSNKINNYFPIFKSYE